MRVLHVFGRMGLGGAERRTADMLMALDTKAHPQHFATLSGLPGVLDPVLEARGAKVHACKLGPRFSLRFGQLLRRVQPHVVHSHVHWPSGPLLAQAAAHGVPGRVAHFRSSPEQPTGLRRLRDRAFRELVDGFATQVAAVSEGSLAWNWPGWQSDPRARVLYSGFDTTGFQTPPDRVGVRAELGIPADAPLLTHVGNVRTEKNHPRIGRLFAQLAERHQDVWLLTIGQVMEPHLLDALRAELAKRGATERWVHAGQRTDVPRLLLASDAFVFPSIREGLPGSVVEARLAGLEVVASDLPGVREIARHLPRVTPLSLDRSDADWLDALDSALGRAPDPWSAGQTPIDSTPFTASASAEAHVACWRASLNPD